MQEVWQRHSSSKVPIINKKSRVSSKFITQREKQSKSFKEIQRKMAFNGELRSVLSSKTVTRGLHSTGVKRMGGHGHDSEPYYLHAKHMYNLDRMKNQKLKMTLGVFMAFSIGVSVPIFAVRFQQKKTSSA